MPDRILLAFLVAASLWSSVNVGYAQGPNIPGRRMAIQPARPPAPAALPAAGAGGYYQPPGAYGATAGYPPGAYGTTGAPGLDPITAAAADPNRKLQAGDRLSFSIEQDRELPTLVAISPTGDVSVQPLSSVRLAGMTLAQAASRLKSELEKDFYYTATVRLNLESAGIVRAGQVSLSGYVNRVGELPLFSEKPMTVSQAILAAGGFKQFAREGGVKITRVGKSGQAETFTVDVKSILNGGRVEKDVTLQDGDRIFVPSTFFKIN